MFPPYHDQNRTEYVDVSVIEFAAHTAYLDPQTGTGYLVTPRVDGDVEALEDPLVEAAWSGQLTGLRETGHLSLHAADRRHAMSRLANRGWTLLRDEDGEAELARRTTDGRQAVCIYGPSAVAQPTLDALDRAIIALDIAADLDLHSEDHDELPTSWWD